jgi:hypothetical protein
MPVKFKITSKQKEQLDEMLGSNLMFSTDPNSEFEGSQVSTTEPVGNAKFGNPITSDDKENDMPPSPLNRMTTNARYIGPLVY